MSRGGKGKVGFSKPPEPKFIRDLKAKVGYREPVGLDAKMGGGDGDLDGLEDREDRDDERPTIVVLKKGDLTEEEVENVKQELTVDDKSEEVPSDGRIMFKKPSKRENSDKDSSKESDIKSKKKKKAEKASSLLSFDEDEEDYS